MKTKYLEKCLAAGILMIFAVVVSSCSGERLTANNNVITESRSVTGFERVEAGGANKVHVSYGERFNVELKGSSNLVPVFETKVDDETLILGYKSDVNVGDDDVEVFVTLPVLNGAALNGSGNMDIRGSFPEVRSFIVNTRGSGDISVSDSFSCSTMEVEISGSGKARLTELQAKRANVKISGSGDTYIHAEDELEVEINGSGTVYYSGSPNVKSEINGSGQVKRL